jgi:hypothetical protein
LPTPLPTLPPPLPPPLLTTEQILLIGPDGSLHLTDEAVEDAEVAATKTTGVVDEERARRLRDCRVVITTVDKNAGYSLTRFDVMLTGVYPSSAAKRRQLEGRLVRRGQKSRVVRFRTYAPGILRNIQKRHDKAESLSAAIKLMRRGHGQRSGPTDHGGRGGGVGGGGQRISPTGHGGCGGGGGGGGGQRSSTTGHGGRGGGGQRSSK